MSRIKVDKENMAVYVGDALFATIRKNKDNYELEIEPLSVGQIELEDSDYFQIVREVYKVMQEN